MRYLFGTNGQTLPIWLSRASPLITGPGEFSGKLDALGPTRLGPSLVRLPTFHECSDMSDNDPDVHERRRKPKNWFSKAKDIILKTLGLYEVDHDDHPTAHNQQWVMIPRTLQVGHRGQTVHHWCSTRLLIWHVLLSGPDQHRLHQIPEAQDTHGSGEGAAQIAPVREPPSLYFTVLLPLSITISL